MSDLKRPPHLVTVFPPDLKPTRIDPFRVRRRSEPPAPKPQLKLDTWEMGQLHKELKAARKASAAALARAREAIREAETASIRAYLALGSFESHMKPLFEKHGWDFSEFETIESDEGPEGDGA